MSRIADVAEKFYAKLYPEHTQQTAVIHRQSDEKKKHFDDKMPEGWEDEQPIDVEPGRFEDRFKTAKQAR